MKKIFALIALMIIAAPAFADINPYQPEQTTVPVTVTVEQIAEVFTNTAAVALTINDFASWSEATGAAPGTEIARPVYVLTNIDATVSASVAGTIPVSMIFNVLVNPSMEYAGDVIGNFNWKPCSGNMLAFSNGDVAAKPAFNVAAMAAGALPATTTVGYAAQSVNGLTPPNDYSFNVVWTIAAQ